MTQKDKVKELVGRGLDSYHTKALQQMDRIEKKNKEQNHKISILSNELDNDYLTKSEEGSVISLEHSKEGMVYLDELQGNTLVNYCTDGSKEMTLNGDIDVEGISVTTTEGVDNGKVDVMCEGNTLVNLVDKMWNNTQTYYTIDENYITILDSETDHRQGYYTLSGGQLNLIKPNTTYTIIAEITKNTLQRNFTLINNFQANGGDITSDDVSVPIGFVGRYVGKFTTLSDFTNRNRLGFSAGSGNRGEITLRNNFIILEGDWTNRDIPVSYFKGMKSVGQDDTNGHKIEILSRNKNLFDINSWKDATVSSGQRFDINNNTVTILGYNSDTYTKTGATGSNVCSEGERKYLIEVKPNTTYTLSMEVEGETSRVNYVQQYNENYANLGLVNYGSSTNDKVTFTTKPNCKYVGFRIGVRGTGATLVYSNILLEEGSQKTNYVNYNTNKKEILLNEPLVGNDTVKDRVVKIGGKLFIERFWETVTLDGTQEIVKGNWDVPIFSYYIPNTEGEPTDFPKTLICDRITPKSFNLNDDTHWALYTGKDSVESQRYIRMQIPASIISKDDLEGFKTWLRNNPITIAYRLNAPIYEPLEVEPILNTYNDVTHISNNSIIPCNMKIQNSGYNAIIKPSTLYTVALDTDKSGTIGMNLGGAKGTTTNNVLTLTTPATLTDDSLRIYGKGIKGSKVRLLEGDKTNWIPSFFEGMKSSFEDKFDVTDNTYKMEILSNNKNLFDGNWTRIGNSKQHETSYIKVSPNSNYIFSVSDNYNTNSAERRFNVQFYDKHKNYLGFIVTGYLPNNVKINTPYNCKYIKIITRANTDFTGEYTNIEYCDVQLEKGMEVTSYVSPKSNKIQFSSIEPLRGVDDVKDRFVFKDGKLMIERNCGTGSLDGTASIYHCWTNNRNDIVSGYIYYNEHKPEITNIKQHSNVVCTDLPNNRGGHISTVEGFRNTAYFAFSIHKSKLGIEDINAGEANQNIVKRYFTERPLNFVYQLAEPTYEEIPFELQKIILEGYENGTLFFDTNIPPTSTVTYAGETPIVKATKLNKTEVLNNTNDINDNIIPYLMDMDYRVVCLELATETQGISMARLFGGVYEMLQRDIQSKRYSIDEYRYRLDAYLSANKITEDEYNKLGDMLNE